MSGLIVKVSTMNRNGGPRYPWAEYLQVVALREQSLRTPPVPLGATDEEIAHHEERLGRRLPPSYRQFLEVANGWRGTVVLPPLLHLCQLGWTRDVDPALGESWGPARESRPTVPDEEYFVYGPEQDCIHLRCEYIPDTLRIAQYIEGQTLMLNPHVITPDGEWEVWDFAIWYPGAHRYRSFWEYMTRILGKPRPELKVPSLPDRG
ncbi:MULTISPECIES: SMI1/KNR4 family protein [Nonomuraea]|uniref:Knr4/Smi1-like domain-containing protein n=2 Tax=Nonomuraea TaxID=83681 RepID=A0ABN3T1L6_9ACTN